MKPETPLPNMNLEKLPVNSGQNVEKIPGLNNNEQGNKAGLEAFEKKSELSSAMNELGIITSSTPVIASDDNAVAVVTSTTVASDNTTPVVSVNPTVANDDELIEKEWVDRAKKIVAETQNNPYQREHDVGLLQVDYLKKRFGRELGVTE